MTHQTLVDDLRELERDLEAGNITESLPAWGADVVRRALLVLTGQEGAPCVCQVEDGLVQEWVAKARSVARSKGFSVSKREGAAPSPRHACDFCGCHENPEAATVWKATADRFRRSCNDLRAQLDAALQAPAGAAPSPQSTDEKNTGLLGTTASGSSTDPPSTPGKGSVRALVEDLEFAIDVTEPRDVILRRFADILERSPLWR